MNKRSNLVSVGRITGVFGVKGWVKVNSSTEPKENIIEYSPWWLKTRHGVKAVEVAEYNFRSQGLIVRLDGVTTRDEAADFSMVDIAIEKSQMPTLDEGEYFWHQLIGLRVVNNFDGVQELLGEVKELLETGANDVLVVKPISESKDDRERVIPYIPGMYVKEVDLDVQEIHVEWDPDF